jgi:hypothetical protein
VSLLVDVGENNRLRFEIDPVVLALAAGLVVRLWRSRRAAPSVDQS